MIMHRNKCMHKTSGTQYLEDLVLAKNVVQEISCVKFSGSSLEKAVANIYSISCISLASTASSFSMTQIVSVVSCW